MKDFTIEDFKHASDVFLSQEVQAELRDHEIKYRNLVHEAIAAMRKELNDTLEGIVNLYADPKPQRPYSTESLQAAGIEVWSGVDLRSNIHYRVIQGGKQIGPDVLIKWPGVELPPKS